MMNIITTVVGVTIFKDIVDTISNNVVSDNVVSDNNEESSYSIEEQILQENERLREMQNNLANREQKIIKERLRKMKRDDALKKIRNDLDVKIMESRRKEMIRNVEIQKKKDDDTIKEIQMRRDNQVVTTSNNTMFYCMHCGQLGVIPTTKKCQLCDKQQVYE